MNCFQSIEAVTARPSAGAADRSEDKRASFAPPILRILSFDLPLRPTGVHRRLHQTPFLDEPSKIGDEGYAVFLREDFQPKYIIILTAVGTIITTATVLSSVKQSFHLFELVTLFQISLIVGYAIVTTPLLAFLVLRPKKLQLTEVIWMGSSLAYTFVLYFYRRTWQAETLNVFLPWLGICSAVQLFKVRGHEWTERQSPISLDWKEIRLSFLHDRGSRQP